MKTNSPSKPHTLRDFMERYASHPHYQAPRGNTLYAKSWQTEAPLRMLLNNLDREVAENPEELIVYGGSGKAARNREALEKIIACLLELTEDQSLLIQSGKTRRDCSYPSASTPRIDCQQQLSAAMGELGTF